MEERKTNPRRLVEMGAMKPENPIESRRESIAPSLRKTSLTAEERHQLIAKAAYLRASRRGFTPGSELDDWIAAEAEIDRTYPRSGVTRSA